MTDCKHTRTSDGPHHGFTCPVYVEPYTRENRAAHGCVTYTETCLDCGWDRSINANQGHHEFGPWGESQAQLTARAERALIDAACRAGAGKEIAAVASADWHGAEVIIVATGTRQIVRRTYVTWRELDAAAEQDDAQMARMYTELRAEARKLQRDVV